MISCLPLQKENNQNKFTESNKSTQKFIEQVVAAPQKDRTNYKLIEKKHQYFRYDDPTRLDKLKQTIESAPDAKPIRLYLSNIPNYANEFDFEDRCSGLLNVVWNYKRQGCCFILIADKKKAIETLALESTLPKFCKSGHIFVSRVEENSILSKSKPSPQRFQTYCDLEDKSGFFIVENNSMKYFWYDQKRGFYDEFGIYYNNQGKPQAPPYIQRNNRNNNQKENSKFQNKADKNFQKGTYKSDSGNNLKSESISNINSQNQLKNESDTLNRPDSGDNLTKDRQENKYQNRKRQQKKKNLKQEQDQSSIEKNENRSLLQVEEPNKIPEKGVELQQGGDFQQGGGEEVQKKRQRKRRNQDKKKSNNQIFQEKEEPQNELQGQNLRGQENNQAEKANLLKTQVKIISQCQEQSNHQKPNRQKRAEEQ